MSALGVILTVWRFRDRLDHHIHRTVANAVYCRLHLMLVKKCEQLIQFFLREDNVPAVSRAVLIWLVHRCSSRTKRTILNELHRPDRKMIAPLTSTISLFHKCLGVIKTLKQALLIMADIQLTSRIQCFVGIHDTLPVFARKCCEVVRLYTGKAAFVQFFCAVGNIVFYFFL